MYSVLVVVHVVAAIVAFGALALSGVYGGAARRPDGAEEAARFFATRAFADPVMLSVPVLGLAAVAVGGDGLGRAWVAIALVLWLVAVVAALGVARPARREVAAGLAGGVGAVALAAPATRLVRAAAVVDVVFVVAVVDMVVKPG